MRRWGWPLHSMFVVLPALAIAVAAAIGTLQMWDWPYLTWIQTSAQWHQQFTWAGVIAGAAACLWAVRLNRADRVWVQPQARRLGGPVVARQLGMLVSWFAGAYIVGLLPLTIVTFGGTGTPDVLVMLSGLLAVAAATALGHAVGTVSGSPVAVPVVAMLMLALYAVSAYGGEQVAAVTPMIYREPVLGQTEPTSLLLSRSMLFIAVTGGATVLVTLVLRWQARGRRSSLVLGGGIAACAAPAVILVAAALSIQPPPYVNNVDNASGAKECRVVHGIQYCVHRDNTDRLSQLIDTIDPVVTRYGARPTRFHAVWDQTLQLDNPPMGKPTPQGRLLPILNPDGSIDVDSSGLELAFLPVDRCSESDMNEFVEVYFGLRDYLRAGKATTVFTRMSDREIQDWIRGHQHQIDTCTISAEDLPSA